MNRDIENVVDNNKKISELLDENEKLLKENHFVQHNEIENGEEWIPDTYIRRDEQLIHIPRGYIRARYNDNFDEMYHLKSIIYDIPDPNNQQTLQADTMISNIIYYLEAIDCNSFFINRFAMYGVALDMYELQVITSIDSIMETLSKVAVNLINLNWSKDNELEKNGIERPCIDNLKYFAGTLEWACSPDNPDKPHISRLSNEDILKIKDFHELRNNGHMDYRKEKITKIEAFKENLLRYGLDLLKILSDDIYENWVRYY